MLTNQLKEKQREFDRKFEECFNLADKLLNRYNACALLSSCSVGYLVNLWFLVEWLSYALRPEHNILGTMNSYTLDDGKLIREVLKMPELRLVPHVGYVSLFPFIGRIIPSESWILEKQLDLMSNRSILWTDYGLRSLAKTSTLYMKRNTEHDPPYWRGPIWMNMNYMILSALHHYSRGISRNHNLALLISVAEGSRKGRTSILCILRSSDQYQ
ncbi:uncharacterized protein LOC120000593 [Tripterygium wilfordii]|uniref:uncharacterized protein LOC120000593 n=1 Tax=Tripterygium wilfordii TaxID=458696 RepID=UPI0018F80785|nr:uncharacterized protein LOC120000593 [Tripterygium wilfordii]